MKKRTLKRIFAEEVAEKTCQGSSFGAFRVKTESAQNLFQKLRAKFAAKIERKQGELKEVLNFDVPTQGDFENEKRGSY